MKAIIMIIALCGLYYGMNFYNLSEGAVRRMVQQNYMPSKEKVDTLCSFVKANTKVKYTYKVNKDRDQVASNSPTTICKYWQSYIPTKIDWQDVNINEVKVERIQRFPYNEATANISVRLSYQTTTKKKTKESRTPVNVTEVIIIDRKEKVHYRRGFMGSYEYISLEGHDNVTRPEEKKRR